MIYCRISLDAEGTGLGVERECRTLCERHGWDVTDVYVDNDISATTGKRRPEFERLLSDPPTRIVTWHTDRLVRLTRELERVIKAGVPVHTGSARERGARSGHTVARSGSPSTLSTTQPKPLRCATATK